jgi:hypothetical protein
MKPLITEIWTQDIENPDLWHGNYGVMLNTAALNEREAFFEVTRVPAMPQMSQEQRYFITR